MIHKNKKILKMFVIFVIITLWIYPSKATVDITELANLVSEVQSGKNVKAYKELSVGLIEEVFSNNANTSEVMYLMRILGTNKGSEAFYVSTQKEANIYISLVSKLKQELDNDDNGILVTNVQTALGSEYNSLLSYMESIKKYAQTEDFSTSDPGDDVNSGNGNGEEINKDSIFDLDWDKISVETYGGQGLSSLDDVKKLYEKLMDVNYSDLSDEDRQKWFDRSRALESYMLSTYPVSDSEDMATEIDKILTTKPIYNNPLINYNPNETAENVTPDSIIADADTFMADGQSSDVATINQNNANIAFNSIYNILLAIGITVTVIWGLIIAIKLMMSSVEEKAEYKKMLWPYLVGCIVIFGSFAIWKIVIVAMNNVL